MALERIAVVPKVERLGKPFLAFLVPPLHLEHVGHRVERPEIICAGLDSPPAIMLGEGVFAVLLIAERQHAADIAIARHVLLPAWQHRSRYRTQRAALSHPKAVEVMQAQRQQVVRIFKQDTFPTDVGADQVAVDPATQGLDVQSLAAIGGADDGLGLPQRVAGPIEHAERAEQHEQIAEQTMRHGKRRVRGNRILGKRHRRQPVFEEISDGGVEGGDGSLIPAAQLQPAIIDHWRLRFPFTLRRGTPFRVRGTRLAFAAVSSPASSMRPGFEGPARSRRRS
jgi:hypothetical protein